MPRITLPKLFILSAIALGVAAYGSSLASLRPGDLSDLAKTPGGNFPFLNYAPTLITGKPCPRAKEWDVENLTPPYSNKPVIVTLSDDCVYQNAIDYYVAIAWAEPQFNRPSQIKALETELLKDSLKNSFALDTTSSSIAITTTWHDVTSGRWYRYYNYLTCNTPDGGRMYRLLDTQPLYNPVDKELFLPYFMVPETPGPYHCEYRNVTSDQVIFQFGFGADELNSEKAVFSIRFAQMQFDPKTARWKFVGDTGQSSVGFDYVDELYKRTVK